jgi:hypothetical protein
MKYALAVVSHAFILGQNLLGNFNVLPSPSPYAIHLYRVYSIHLVGGHPKANMSAGPGTAAHKTSTDARLTMESYLINIVSSQNGPISDHRAMVRVGPRPGGAQLQALLLVFLVAFHVCAAFEGKGGCHD